MDTKDNDGLDLNGLEELERAATPAPWEYDDDPGSFIIWQDRTQNRVAFMTSGPEGERNADFLCSLRNAAPALIAAARRERAAKRAATSHIGDPCIYCGTPHDDVPPGPCQGVRRSPADVVREQAARIVDPSECRPCGCDRCNCGNQDDAAAVAVWDAAHEDAKRIRSLPILPDYALAAANARAADLQRDRASLSDKLNGTPCAEIRWQQEREELTARVAELSDELRKHACKCPDDDPCEYSNGCPGRRARLLSRPADGEQNGH